ncbi:MAG: ribosome recycling factor [Candidatus Zambryskibacteria bacterium]|nr:ribosome recycling factor [Candidatus Zambryskibacteria bacterium]
MPYNFIPLRQNVKGIEEWLRKEFATIRTGRATPAILDGVKVEAYGSDMTITQLANISMEDARMIRITPWDMSQVKAIEKGIVTSDLGLSVAVDDKGIRVIFPELTSDRRTSLIKIARQKLEDARVTLRTERERIMKDIEKQEKEGIISEDDKFRLKTELQKMLDDTNRVLDGMLVKKEKEISE